MLYGKNVVLGVSGGIACYKACELVSRLKKAGANVDVIMTEHATEFVAPLSFQTLAKTPVVTDMFAPIKAFDINHISLAKKADILVVAPATANVIAKFANGIADDMLSTTYSACKAPKLICPAMNPDMYSSDANASNMTLLRSRGVLFEEPDTGIVACGDSGKGRLAEPERIADRIAEILCPKRDFEGKTVVVTAGGTEESLDGVRFITNRSSGKMGTAIADAAARRGAEVIFICGRISVPSPDCVKKVIQVRSTRDMYDAVLKESENAEVIIMAAAPADYRPKNTFRNKIKSETLTLELEKNPDIAAAVGRNKGSKKLVVFAAETENLMDNAAEKLFKKNADLIVANDVTKEGAGFDSDTNIATILDRAGNRTESGSVKKSELAELILDKVAELK